MENTNLVYDVRHISTIKELVESSAELFGERTAFVLKKDGKIKELNFNEVLSDVMALATYFNSLGYEGKRIAVMGKNSYEWLLTYLAVMSGTGIIVPIDKDLKSPEVANILNFSESDLIVYANEVGETIEKTGVDISKICMTELAECLSKGKSLIESGAESYKNHKIDPYALGALLYTSGTTGVAKGVMLSHNNICSDIVAVRKVFLLTPEDRTLSVLPLHHTYECFASLAFLYSGASIAYMTSLTHILADFKEYQPTFFVAVPLLLKTLHTAIMKKVKAIPGGSVFLNVGKTITTLSGKSSQKVGKKIFKTVHEAFGGKLHTLLCGAAALDPEIFRDFEKLGFRVMCGYGLTETSPISVMHNDRAIIPGTVGFPISGSKAKIINPNDDGVGELAVKGPHVMLGYYNNPEATAEVFDEEGYFKTGDLAKVDKSSGHYIITGRIKNMIVIGNGKKVFPEEIEYLLEKCDAVKECMAYGHTDDEGYVSVAVKIFPDFEYLSAKEGISKDAQNISAVLEDYYKKIIKEQVNKFLPQYKAVKKIFLRFREFDKTTTKKIKRNSEDNLND